MFYSGLAVLGNISIGGAIERALNFTDKVSLLSEMVQNWYWFQWVISMNFRIYHRLFLGPPISHFMVIIRCWCRRLSWGN